MSEEAERRITLAAMLEASPRYAQLLAGLACEHRDEAQRVGSDEIADVWASIASAASEAVCRLEALRDHVDGSFGQALPGIIDESEW